tara:strand:- start:382 stop:1086 length:705 start_codon:yes stop_codon:yes gene_type:complete
MVNIDTVYQRVLAFANKEQRGYITPQEFNLFANQAQMEIFEQYFYDKKEVSKKPGNETSYSDPTKMLAEKIQIFERGPVSLTQVGSMHQYPDPLGPNPLWRLGVVAHGGEPKIAHEYTMREATISQNSPLTAPTNTHPAYIRMPDGILLAPATGTCRIWYLTSPAQVSWGYFVVGDRALYDPNPTKTTNFELHASEETELVYKILKFAGVAMKRQDITMAGQGLEATQQQQENK